MPPPGVRPGTVRPPIAARLHTVQREAPCVPALPGRAQKSEKLRRSIRPSTMSGRKNTCTTAIITDRAYISCAISISFSIRQPGPTWTPAKNTAPATMTWPPRNSMRHPRKVSRSATTCANTVTPASPLSRKTELQPNARTAEEISRSFPRKMKCPMEPPAITADRAADSTDRTTQDTATDQPRAGQGADPL